jgi:hypothetical protein
MCSNDANIVFDTHIYLYTLIINHLKTKIQIFNIIFFCDNMVGLYSLRDVDWWCFGA